MTCQNNRAVSAKCLLIHVSSLKVYVYGWKWSNKWSLLRSCSILWAFDLRISQCSTLVLNMSQIAVIWKYGSRLQLVARPNLWTRSTANNFRWFNLLWFDRAQSVNSINYNSWQCCTYPYSSPLAWIWLSNVKSKKLARLCSTIRIQRASMRIGKWQENKNHEITD